MFNTTTRLDDNSLWNAVIEGSEPAFEELYRRYFQVLFSYGKRLTRDEELVNDAIQDLFVDIWRTRFSLSEAQSVRFYLLSSLRRKIYRSLKKESSKGEDLENISEIFLPFQNSSEAAFINDEENQAQSERLGNWLSQLPARQNEALVLRFYHELEYHQIAELLSIQEQTARNLVQKALQILRKLAIYLIFFVINIIL